MKKTSKTHSTSRPAVITKSQTDNCFPVPSVGIANQPPGRTQEPDDPPAFSFACDDHRFEFRTPGELTSDAVARIEQVCQGATEVPSFVVADLLSWSDEQRKALFSIFRQLTGPYEVTLGEHTGPSLFDAVLATMEGPNDIRRCGRGEAAAIEAAIIEHGDNAELAATAIVERRKELGIKGKLPQQISKEIKAAFGSAREDDPGNDPLAIADIYVQEVSKQKQLAADVLPVRYFQSDFFMWTGTVWRRIADEEFRASLCRFLQTSGLSVPLTKSLLTNVEMNLTGKCVVTGWNETQMPLWLPAEGETKPSPYLAFSNGLVDLEQVLLQKTGKVKVLPLTPEHFSNIVLPYEFDHNAKCPLWLKVLGRVLKPMDDTDRRIDVLQEAFGWCLLTGKNHLHLERFFILHGAGENGKSTVCNVLEAMLGKENVSHVSLESFGGEYSLYPMMDKLANIAREMSRPETEAEGILKALVSCEPVQVNRKHKDLTTMYSSAKLFFATNELPTFIDRTNGIWRRVLVMPFTVAITDAEKDPQLLGKLKEELPGILNWALEGARRLMKSERLTLCAVCEQAKNDHRRAIDPFLGFMAEHVVWHEKESRFAGDDNLYKAYKDYCMDSNYKAVSKAKFEQRLKKEVEAQAANKSAGGKTRPSLKLRRRGLLDCA